MAVLHITWVWDDYIHVSEGPVFVLNVVAIEGLISVNCCRRFGIARSSLHFGDGHLRFAVEGW